MDFKSLKEHNIYVVPVGKYFKKNDDACYLVYSPLANIFYLATPNDAIKLEEQINTKEQNATLSQLLNQSPPAKKETEFSINTFCTLHLLLNEKCNFHCTYCYSAEGRSSAEVTIEQIRVVLDYFLSSERAAIKERTVMFMGGGEPVLSWDLVESATAYAKQVASQNGINVHFSLTTNGSILNNRMIEFFKKHDFTIQISFEVLPDIQNMQRGMNDAVARNLKRLTEEGINNYVRSTITPANVDRITEMVEYCHEKFPKVTKLSCQQVVDPSYFTSNQIVDDFFNRYLSSFQQGLTIAEKYGIQLRSSSSHLAKYSKREKFCYNLVCLTPYGTLTTCPDVSSPNESDYNQSVFATLKGENISFDDEAFEKITNGSIHTIEKCRECWAKWNCGSGCPSSRRVYKPEIFDHICNYYREILCNNLMNELASKYEKATGKDFYTEIASKL